MRKITVSQFISLDGVIETPEKWHFPYVGEDMAADIKEQILASEAALYGRVTYDVFAGAWPGMTNNEFGIADQLNNQPKYVVSNTLKQAVWKNSTIISGDNIMGQIADLKQQPGGSIAITGSATLVQALIKADLIDLYRLYVHPIVLGSGLRLFQDGLPQKGLKLVETKQFQTGVMVLAYEPDRK